MMVIKVMAIVMVEAIGLIIVTIVLIEIIISLGIDIIRRMAVVLMVPALTVKLGGAKGI
jgi:hypothetical protein